MLLSLFLLTITAVMSCTFGVDLPCERKYFSNGVQPLGAAFLADSHRVGICQRYQGVDFYYSLFDTRYRIPVYSAYIPAPEPEKGARTGRRRTGRWYVEHSLAPASNKTQGMGQWPGSRGHLKRPLRDQLPYYQAVDADYSESGFNRGHLNPHFIQDGAEARLATFTLTNAVPQEPCFNQVAWKRAEELFDDVFVHFCHSQNGTVHALTGAVPNYPADGSDLRKTRTISCGDNDDGCGLWRPEDPHDVYHRVNIPTRMWTAACCRYQTGADQHAIPYHHSGLNARDGQALINVGGFELRHFEQQLADWYYEERGAEDVSIFGQDLCSTGESDEEARLRESLLREADGDRSVVIGGDLSVAPERQRGRLLSLQLTQELDPMLLQTLGSRRDIKELTRRIYGLLALGKYFVKCVDPLENFVDSHSDEVGHHHALEAPYCTLALSYERGDPIPNLSNLKPPFPLPDGVLSGIIPSATAGEGGRTAAGDPHGSQGRTCGDSVIPLTATSGSITSDEIATTLRTPPTPGCRLRLAGDQLSFITATLQASNLQPDQYIDVYDHLHWLLRVNSSTAVQLMTSQYQLGFQLSDPEIRWSLNYQQHALQLRSGDMILLVDQRTCAALSYPQRRRGWPHVRFSPTVAQIGRHQLLLDFAPGGAPVAAGRRVRLRVARTTDAGYDMLYSSFTANIYYDRFDDSSKQLWLVGGLPRHGGVVTLRNVRYDDYFFGVKDEQLDDGGVFKGQLCRNDNRWLVYKTPAGEATDYAGFDRLVRTACATGKNKPVCLV